MVNKPQQPAKHVPASNFFKSVVLTGTTLFVMLQPWFSKNNTKVKAELKNVLEQYDDAKTYEVKESEKTAEFESVKDTIDPYDQIKGYVEAQNMEYFNKLKAHMETKDIGEQTKCKAVVYAILQDKELTTEQRHILALAYFERLARMPVSDYRFRLQWKKTYEKSQVYIDRTNFYSWYKEYLELVDIEEEGKKLDEEITKLNKKVENLRKQNKLLQQLLNWYNDK